MLSQFFRKKGISFGVSGNGQSKTKGIGQKVDEQTFFVDAIADLEDGELFQAAESFQMFVKLVPDHGLANIFLARTHIALSNFQDAIDALFNHLKFVDETSIEANIYLGVAYYEMGESELALQRFETAYENGGKGYMVRENIAITKMQAGRYQDSLDDLMKLLNEIPDDPGIKELVGTVLGKMGRWESAKIYRPELSSKPPQGTSPASS